MTNVNLMAYSTIKDIKDAIEPERLAQWTDDEAGVQINDARVDRAIADADSIIDSYCSRRYDVPFTTVPNVVRRASVVVAIKYLASRRGFALTDEQQKAYEEIIAWLRDVSRGLANIDATTQPTASTQSQGSYTADDRDFTKDSMGGF